MSWKRALSVHGILCFLALSAWILSHRAPLLMHSISIERDYEKAPTRSVASASKHTTIPAPPTRRWPAEAIYLRDVRICLDPGHGGQAHRPGFKRGPTGFREAVANLRVALFFTRLPRTCGRTGHPHT